MISASLRISELAGGIATGFLGFFLYVYISVKDAQLDRPPEPSAYVLALIMMVLPGVIVFIGSYIQTVRRNVW
jgi:hypothetical protein